MTADRYRSAAEEVLAILDADATLIDDFDATEIEALPIADIKKRLLELELSPTTPAALKDAIRSSIPAPASRGVSQFLTEDAKEFRAIEKQPLAEVTGRLRKWGLNYEAGTDKIIDLVRRHARTNSKAMRSRRYFIPTLWAASLVAALFAGGILRTVMRTHDRSFPSVASLAPSETNFQVRETVAGSNQKIEKKVEGVVALASRTGPVLPSISETPTTDAKKVRTIPIRPEGDANASSTNAVPSRPHEAPTMLAMASTPGGADTTPSQTEAVAPHFVWPVRGQIITRFGSLASGQPSGGLDIAVSEGTAVKAADDGVVAYAGNELKGYRNLILVRHSSGFVTAYANVDELLVRRGDTVKRGHVIARFAKTTDPALPQLHFEIRKGSSPVDPTTYLPARQDGRN
jgi:murein DD-endopeptidase MepM/ murein hydrolase activator NlpD